MLSKILKNGKVRDIVKNMFHYKRRLDQSESVITDLVATCRAINAYTATEMVTALAIKYEIECFVEYVRKTLYLGEKDQIMSDILSHAENPILIIEELRKIIPKASDLRAIADAGKAYLHICELDKSGYLKHQVALYRYRISGDVEGFRGNADFPDSRAALALAEEKVKDIDSSMASIEENDLLDGWEASIEEVHAEKGRYLPRAAAAGFNVPYKDKAKLFLEICGLSKGVSKHIAISQEECSAVQWEFINDFSRTIAAHNMSYGHAGGQKCIIFKPDAWQEVSFYVREDGAIMPVTKGIVIVSNGMLLRKFPGDLGFRALEYQRRLNSSLSASDREELYAKDMRQVWCRHVDTLLDLSSYEEKMLNRTKDGLYSACVVDVAGAAELVVDSDKLKEGVNLVEFLTAEFNCTGLDIPGQELLLYCDRPEGEIATKSFTFEVGDTVYQGGGKIMVRRGSPKERDTSGLTRRSYAELYANFVRTSAYQATVMGVQDMILILHNRKEQIIVYADTRYGKYRVTSMDEILRGIYAHACFEAHLMGREVDASLYDEMVTFELGKYGLPEEMEKSFREDLLSTENQAQFCAAVTSGSPFNLEVVDRAITSERAVELLRPLNAVLNKAVNIANLDYMVRGQRALSKSLSAKAGSVLKAAKKAYFIQVERDVTGEFPVLPGIEVLYYPEVKRLVFSISDDRAEEGIEILRTFFVEQTAKREEALQEYAVMLKLHILLKDPNTASAINYMLRGIAPFSEGEVPAERIPRTYSFSGVSRDITQEINAIEGLVGVECVYTADTQKMGFKVFDIERASHSIGLLTGFFRQKHQEGRNHAAKKLQIAARASLERWRATRERAAQEKIEQERLAAEQAEKVRIAKEEADRIAKIAEEERVAEEEKRKLLEEQELLEEAVKKFEDLCIEYQELHSLEVVRSRSGKSCIIKNHYFDPGNISGLTINFHERDNASTVFFKFPQKFIESGYDQLQQRFARKLKVKQDKERLDAEIALREIALKEEAAADLLRIGEEDIRWNKLFEDGAMLQALRFMSDGSIESVAGAQGNFVNITDYSSLDLPLLPGIMVRYSMVDNNLSFTVIDRSSAFAEGGGVVRLESYIEHAIVKEEEAAKLLNEEEAERWHKLFAGGSMLRALRFTGDETISSSDSEEGCFVDVADYAALSLPLLPGVMVRYSREGSLLSFSVLDKATAFAENGGVARLELYIEQAIERESIAARLLSEEEEERWNKLFADGVMLQALRFTGDEAITPTDDSSQGSFVNIVDYSALDLPSLPGVMVRYSKIDNSLSFAVADKRSAFAEDGGVARLESYIEHAARRKQQEEKEQAVTEIQKIVRGRFSRRVVELHKEARKAEREAELRELDEAMQKVLVQDISDTENMMLRLPEQLKNKLRILDVQSRVFNLKGGYLYSPICESSLPVNDVDFELFIDNIADMKELDIKLKFARELGIDKSDIKVYDQRRFGVYNVNIKIGNYVDLTIYDTRFPPSMDKEWVVNIDALRANIKGSIDKKFDDDRLYFTAGCVNQYMLSLQDDLDLYRDLMDNPTTIYSAMLSELEIGKRFFNVQANDIFMRMCFYAAKNISPIGGDPYSLLHSDLLNGPEIISELEFLERFKVRVNKFVELHKMQGDMEERFYKIVQSSLSGEGVFSEGVRAWLDEKKAAIGVGETQLAGGGAGETQLAIVAAGEGRRRAAAVVML